MVPHLQLQENIVKHARKELVHFGVRHTYNLLQGNIGGKTCSWRFNNLFHDE